MINGILNKRGNGKNKKAQEEIVGFVVIIVIVAVIVLIFLGFMLKRSDRGAVGDYEIDSFIGASLQYTTDCESSLEFLSVEELIYYCDLERKCINEKDSCAVLNETIAGIVENGWNVKEGSAIKGYKFIVMSGDKVMLSVEKGNFTGNYKGGFQNFARSANSYEISLNIYY